MKVITSLDEIDQLEPHAFTIGTFDGVHRGHKKLFAELKETDIPKGIEKLESSQGSGADFCVWSEGHCQRLRTLENSPGDCFPREAGERSEPAPKGGPKRRPKMCCQADVGANQFLIHEGYNLTAVITFSTHPLKTLRPENPLLLITPLSTKLALLQAEGFDLVVVLPFSKEISDLPFDQFLDYFPMSHLILGKGATFGKDKQGTEGHVRAWANERGISVDYIEKVGTISSRRIRDAIKIGDLALAEQLLGRPHLLSVPANSTQFSVSGLSMPPDGTYPLSLDVQATLSTSSEGRFIELSKQFPQTTLLSFNPTRHYVIE